MTNGIVKVQSKQAMGRSGRIHRLLNELSVEEPDQINPKRQQFLALLKRRYGYTNEKAVDEMERLLKQFYRSNRSLGIPHPRPDFKQPYAE